MSIQHKNCHKKYTLVIEIFLFFLNYNVSKKGGMSEDYMFALYAFVCLCILCAITVVLVLICSFKVSVRVLKPGHAACVDPEK
jgi:hypothetical protein